MSKRGHPLPDSDEARHDEIPEHMERDKGRGDDPQAAVQPQGEAVNPDGEPYRVGDPGRGPDLAGDAEELASDQASHQDRGQSTAEEETDGG